MKLDKIEFNEPWELLDDLDLPSPTKLDTELSRTLAPGHVLEGNTFCAVARRFDRDDVLFHITSPEELYAVVHLTWATSRETDPAWPRTEIFATLDDFVNNRMKPDIEMF